MCWLQDRGLLEVSKYSSKSSKMNGLLKAYHSKKLQPRTSRSLENLRWASSCDILIISKVSKSLKLQKLRFTKLLCGGFKLFRVSSFLGWSAELKLSLLGSLKLVGNSSPFGNIYMPGDLLPWSLRSVSLKQVDNSSPWKYLYAWGFATLELGTCELEASW